MKVYGGGIKKGHNGTVRCIVAADSVAEALRFLESAGHSMGRKYFNDYWCETGNENELNYAKSKGVWIAQKDYGKVYDCVYTPEVKS